MSKIKLDNLSKVNEPLEIEVKKTKEKIPKLTKDIE